MTRNEFKQRAINNLLFAIEELREAIKFIRNNKFESAENEIADA